MARLWRPRSSRKAQVSVLQRTTTSSSQDPPRKLTERTNAFTAMDAWFGSRLARCARDQSVSLATVSSWGASRIIEVVLRPQKPAVGKRQSIRTGVVMSNMQRTN